MLANGGGDPGGGGVAQKEARGGGDEHEHGATAALQQARGAATAEEDAAVGDAVGQAVAVVAYLHLDLRGRGEEPSWGEEPRWGEGGEERVATEKVGEARGGEGRVAATAVCGLLCVWQLRQL